MDFSKDENNFWNVGTTLPVKEVFSTLLPYINKPNKEGTCTIKTRIVGRSCKSTVYSLPLLE